MRSGIGISAVLMFAAAAATADPAHDLFTGQNISAADGRIARFACHGCHGRDGYGGVEGKVPRIAGEVLGRPTALRPAYDAVAFGRALTDGVDPRGRSLSRIMPRYDLDAAETELLWHYLEQLPIRQAAGVTPSSVRLGVVIDPDNPEMGVRYLHSFAAEFTRAAGASTLHGRRTEIVALTDPEQQANGVLAALAIPAGKTDLIGRLTATGLPVLFALTPLTGSEDKSIQRGFAPTERDVHTAITRHLASSPARRIGIAASQSRTDALSRMIRLAIPYAEVGPVSAHPDGLDALIDLGGAVPQGIGNPAVLYRLASRAQRAAPRQRGFLVLEAPNLIALAIDENLHPLEAHAVLSARILARSIAKAGRNLTRGRLVSVLEETDLASERLDFAHLPLSGTDHVAIIADIESHGDHAPDVKP